MMADASRQGVSTPSPLLFLQIDGVISCSAGLEGIDKNVGHDNMKRSCSPDGILAFKQYLIVNGYH